MIAVFAELFHWTEFEKINLLDKITTQMFFFS